MNDKDYQVIVEFADGDGSLRAEALKAFRARLVECRGLRSDIVAGIMQEPAMQFMSEIDNKCPDYSLRGIARHRLLLEAKKRSESPSSKKETRPRPVAKTPEKKGWQPTPGGPW